ncbi:CBS domain-containing protein [Allokutzneria multivorans]|uniref:CBS domain-containing protein n=1 Tax=Allokutzneria multivorans TaxID=1142134 RepID=A0ABP7S6D1_9PSEU
MRIADVLRGKGSAVATIEQRSSVTELLAALAQHNVGALVVVDADGGLAGIVSERDVVRTLNERGAEVLTGPVSAIMTSRVFTCGPEESVDTLTVQMTERRIRHVPVLDGGALVGIVSIGDVVKSRISQLEQHGEQLQAYISQG